ncbi:MAG TPA: 5'/3'-nucleotidase SurE [Anaerolineales bacterium]
MAGPNSRRPQILLTNDDGIRARGLWAAAEALSSLGYVTVCAPREQYSGAGRSMPHRSDGVLSEEQVNIHGLTWKVYAVGGSPAQAVQHGLLELMPQRPDLVVAGINHGENLTVSVTISGTVGAALEGASFGVPALAVSLEMPQEHSFGNAEDIDFAAAMHFTAVFGDLLLREPALPDVDLLKVDIPSGATPQTPWRVTRLSRSKYYVPVSPGRERLSDSAPVGYEISLKPEELEIDSDVQVVRMAREISVTPMSMDLTSRVDLGELERRLRGTP